MTDASGAAVADHPDRDRYEAMVGDQVAGYAEYERSDGRITFTHTVVDPAFEGQGVGSALARGALDDVRSHGEKLVPRCHVIAGYIDKHPADADLVG